MKQGRVIFYYLIAVFAGAALIAPWLYLALQQLTNWLPSLTSTAQQPFHRYVNRCLIAIAVLGLWPLAKKLGIRSLRDLGLANFGLHMRDLGKGLLVGFAGLALLVTLVLLFGGRQINPATTWNSAISALLSATGTAIAVSVLEEILFRGALFGCLRRPMGLRNAVLLSSVLYAIVHFFAKPSPPPQIEWYTGFLILGQMMQGFSHLEGLIPGFLTLTLAGILLALGFYRTDRLFYSMGVHAGWVFWMKLYGATTTEVPGASNWVWGTQKLIDGWLAFAIMLITLAWTWNYVRKDPAVQY